MAKRFVRVDLSDAARDFRPVAIEPGLPLLDPENANGRLLFKWLGGLVAEPEWHNEAVSFYVQDDHGGRLEDVVCQPASQEDLAGPLKEDVAALRDRLAQAKAESPSERLLLQRVREEFAALVDDPTRLDRDCYLFRYRDVQRRWRLVWCPGYQRREFQPGQAVICTDPDCNLLFVRRPGASARCPGCRAMLLAQGPGRRRPVRWGVGLLLLLVLLALGWWLVWPRRLEVRPTRVELAVGQMHPLQIESNSVWPIRLSSSDASVVEADENRMLRARGPGWAAVEVRQAWRSSRVEVQVKPVPGTIAEGHPPKPPAPPTRAPDATTPVEVAQPGEPIQQAEPTKPGALAKPGARIEPGEVAKAIGPSSPGGTSMAKSAQAEDRGRPVEVVVASDQGDSIRFPVGAAFSDFRVEARYPDGFTRIVTKQATLRTPEDPAASPVSFSDGQMHGVRAGKTTVHAEFAGVATQKGLLVEVTPTAEFDEIRLVPATATLLPGQSLRLDAVGLKAGQPQGSLAALSGLKWNTSDAHVVKIEGPVATGVRPGRAQIVVQLGSLTSQPANLTVAERPQQALRVDPNMVRLRVGESLRIGTDLKVLHGDTDVSGQCSVVPVVSHTLRFDEPGRVLVGIAPGVTPVYFGFGDQMVSAAIEVVAAPFPKGRVVIDPSNATLSPGQAAYLRIYLVTSDGGRIERTGHAKLATSAAEVVQISGDWACALAPGTAEVTASLPESETPGRARITVDSNVIDALIVEPAQVEMAVGDRVRVRVLGRSASGTHELFPQDRLRMKPGGPQPEAIQIVGSQHIEGIRPGQATLEVTWADTFRQTVSAKVTEAPWSQLTIEPASATLHPGQSLRYIVTGVRGGRRRVIRAEEGLQLSVADPNVGQATSESLVRAIGPGSTRVLARLGELTASSALRVVPGSGAAEVVAETSGPAVAIISPEGPVYWVGPGGLLDPPWQARSPGDPGTMPGPVGVAPERPTVASPSPRVWLEPARATVPVGATTPRFVVMRQSPGNPPQSLPATIESTDPRILEPVPSQPGQFVARRMGSTQVRATAGDRVLYADVSVTGAWFQTIRTEIAAPTDTDFGVRAEITASGAQGPLEYRVYVAGEPARGAWVPARVEGDRQRVVLESPRIRTGPPSTFYTLMFEARDPGSATVQQYPFTFRLTPTIERADR